MTWRNPMRIDPWKMVHEWLHSRVEPPRTLLVLFLISTPSTTYQWTKEMEAFCIRWWLSNLGFLIIYFDRFTYIFIWSHNPLHKVSIMDLLVKVAWFYLDKEQYRRQCCEDATNKFKTLIEESIETKKKIHVTTRIKHISCFLPFIY